ncbi:MAG: hypothetical protein WC872_00225 [Candidatus Absconditabacterales bacterium]
MDSLEKKYDELKENFKKIPNNIGALIEITPDVWEILGSLYKTDIIYAKSVEILDKNKFKITFKFPKFEGVIDIAAIDHVSVVQMQAAINQSLYCGIGLSIRQQGIQSPISYEKFLHLRKHSLYRHDERTFRKFLKPGENAYLILEIETIIKKGNMYSINTKFIKDKDCFMDGVVECILQEKYIN